MDYERKKNRYFLFAALLILLFATALRINAPEADLPSHISFSGSIVTDEGNQCHNSRSKALFDEWYPDDWKVTNYNPVLPYFKLIAFKLFGVGMWQLRSVNYLFAFLTLLFFFLTLKSAFSPFRWPALTGLMLLGTHFIFVMYNKIGTFETSITFWVVLSLYFLEKFRAEAKGYFLVLCGAAAFMAFVFKSIIAYFLPLPFAACIIALLFRKGDDNARGIDVFRRLLLVAAGVLLVALPWYFLHYLPNKTWILGTAGNYMSNLMFPKNIAEALRNLSHFNWQDQFFKSPIVWLASLLFIPAFFRRLLTRRADGSEIAYTLLFFAHTFMFFFISYRPTRYFVPVIPAMVFMTVALFRHWSGHDPDEKPIRGPLAFSLLFVLDTAWVALAGVFCLLPLISRFIFPIAPPPLSLSAIPVAALITALFYTTRFGFRKLALKLPRPPFNPRILFIPLAIIMLILSLTADLTGYLSWSREKTYAVRDLSRQLGEKLENAYIAGMTAPAAVLNNRHKALWLFPDFVNWSPSTFNRYPITHALLGADISGEIRHYFTAWPELMERAPLIGVSHIKDYHLHLYDFTAPFIRGVHRPDAAFPEAVLTIINPSRRPNTAQIGLTLLPHMISQHNLLTVTLQPGENTVPITLNNPSDQDPDKWFFFLTAPTPFQSGPLRYEGECFRTKTGAVLFRPEASNQRLLAYDHTRTSPGFLSYGPAAPYAPGIISAAFRLEITAAASKLQPLCWIDIYSHEDKRFLSQLAIRQAQIRENPGGLYTLSVPLLLTRTLEFRVRVTGQASVSLDYVDLSFYQGVYLDNFIPRR